MLRTPLRAMMFWPGHHEMLFEGGKYHAFAQLDGVLEILQLCNSYVLNDMTAIGGHPVQTPWAEDEFSTFVVGQAAKGEAVKTIGHGGTHAFDLTPYENELRLTAAVEEANNAFKALGHGPEHTRLADEARLLQAQSYILLADREDAVYMPERSYGYKALEKYPDLAGRSRHLTEERFRHALKERLADYYRDRPATTVQVPCFLAEVLRNSSTRSGIHGALRQLRDSRAAKNYRDIARVMAAPETSYVDWQKASNELEDLASTAFGKEGMATRVSAGIKLTAGLSSAAVCALFPQLAAASVAMLLPSLVETLDYVDKWLRKRTNLFETYAGTASIDLHSELKRLFPTVGFQQPQLQHFLETKNFGWPDRDAFLRFMTGDARD